jgi:hypothetical protein
MDSRFDGSWFDSILGKFYAEVSRCFPKPLPQNVDRTSIRQKRFFPSLFRPTICVPAYNSARRGLATDIVAK